MRVCSLNPSEEGSNSVFVGIDPPCDPAFYLSDPAFTFHNVFIKKATAVQQIRALVQSQQYDVFVNLCDGAWDEDRAGIEVVQALEFFKVPFTGADSKFYEPSKEIMKMVAVSMDVKTPAFVFAFKPEDIEEACEHLRFPTICKHFNGYSSVGMTKDSRCESADALRQEAMRMLNLFGGVLIEEFIAGREATVLVAENALDPSQPLTFVPVECKFPAGETFKHFDLKWHDYEGIYWTPITEEPLATNLRSSCARIFEGMKGVSYGRCDLRICEKTGDVFFLEINPNCGLFYPKNAMGSADFILSLDPMGPEGFIKHILQVAIQRRQRLDDAKPKCCVRYSPKLGYGLRASQRVAAGDVVIAYEEKAQFLVSKAHVEKNWHGKMQQWFAQYCYPASDNVYFMWSDRPEDWKPINHSCDPNTWYAENGGLDLVARRDIEKDEPVTIDYATFCTDLMAEFECKCGSSKCRGVIRGTDYRNMDIRKAYGSHVSPYVLEKAPLADS
jgi:D-alanine-D-alanine ligase